MWAAGVKRAWEFSPVTCMVSPGWLTVLRDLPRSCLVTPPCGRSPAGAPAAAQRRGRTSLTPTNGGRSWTARKGPFVLAYEGVVLVPGVAGGVVSQAPMWAAGVKRAWEFSPVTCMVSPGWLTVLRDLPRSCLVTPPCGRSPAGAPAAAQRRGRTSLTPTNGGRSWTARKGPFVLAYEGVVLVPGVAGGVVSQAPIRRSAGVLADAMTMCPGTGLLSHVIERGLVAGSCRVAGAPGVW